MYTSHVRSCLKSHELPKIQFVNCKKLWVRLVTSHPNFYMRRGYSARQAYLPHALFLVVTRILCLFTKTLCTQSVLPPQNNNNKALAAHQKVNYDKYHHTGLMTSGKPNCVCPLRMFVCDACCASLAKPGDSKTSTKGKKWPLPLSPQLR